MRLNKEDRDAKIVELYKKGWSFRQLQKRYHVSPNYIAKLVKGIEVICSACGKSKGKVRFHAHHTDRINRPDYTIPLCPSCHAKEEARLRREKDNNPQSFSPIRKTSTALIKTWGVVSKPSTSPPSFSYGPLSPTGKKVVIGVVSTAVVDTLFPTFFPKLATYLQSGSQYYKGKKERWKRKSNSMNRDTFSRRYFLDSE